MDKGYKGFWSTGRLIISIVLMVLSLIVLFQACAAGFVNTMSDNTNDVGGFAGVFLTVTMAAAGITGICTRNSTSKAGPIAAAVILVIGAIVGMCNAAVFGDLMVWGSVCIAFAIVFVICALKTKKTEE